MEWEEIHEPPPAEELLIVDGFKGRGWSRFSLRAWRLVGDHAPVDGPISMGIWAAQIGFGGRGWEVLG